MPENQNIIKQKIDALVAKFDQELADYKQKRAQLIAGFMRQAEQKKIEELRQKLSDHN